MNEKNEYYNRMGKQVLVNTIIDYSNMLDDLLPQLQAYKDKEDKIREYINKYNKVNAEKADTKADRLAMLINADDILQILNEGDK